VGRRRQRMGIGGCGGMRRNNNERERDGFSHEVVYFFSFVRVSTKKILERKMKIKRALLRELLSRFGA
jgi:hypothetical protein